MPLRGSAQFSTSAAGALTVVEHRLANGLTALVVPRRQVPIVVCDLHYRAGSVDDPPGRSGLAHLVEHVLFHGTERFPKGEIDYLTFLAGGSTNAETGEDYTHYWFALPTDRWTLALEIEADRLRNAAIDAAEFERERRVVIEERARELDSAAGRLEDTHVALSYLSHPYRNPILGWLDELRGLSVDDARAFFQRYYRPRHALLVIVGDVDPDDALRRVESQFGDIDDPTPVAPRVYRAEPPQTGRRAFVVDNGEGLPRGILGWHTITRPHADSPALDVLADLLTGGTCGRLRRRLVDRRRLATWVQASQEGGEQAGQFLVRVEMVREADAPRIEAEIAAELRELATRGPTPEELRRCRQRLESAWRWEQQDPAGLAAGLGSVALWRPWQAWPAEHRAALAVGADDIRRVASAYFHEDRLTIGWTRGGPTRYTTPTVDEPPHEFAVAAPALGLKAVRALTPQAASPHRHVTLDAATQILPGGLKLITDSQPETGVVALELYCDGGLLREQRQGVAYLAARMREELRDPAGRGKLVEKFEDAGGFVEFSSTGTSLRARREDMEAALDLLFAAAAQPAFDRSGFNRARARTTDELQGDLDDAMFRIGREFLRQIYGSHPLGRDPRGGLRGLKSLTLEDVRAHQARWFTPDNSFLVVSGDFDHATLVTSLARRLRAWPSGNQPSPPIAKVRKAPAPCRLALPRPGEQAHLVLGHLGIARSDDDYVALVVLDHILGSGPGFVDRLSRVLRDELGLAYAVGGGMTDSADVVPGALKIYLGTSPANLTLARNVVVDLLTQLRDGRFEDNEVRAAQQYLACAHVFDYQNVASRAERLLELERWGLPLTEAHDWPDRVLALSPDEVRAAARRHLHPDRLVEIISTPV